MNADNSTISSFAALVIVQYLIILFLFIVIIGLYSQYKNPLDSTLVLLSILYLTSTGFHWLFMESLVSTGKLKSVSVLEVLTVFGQFIFYVLSSLISNLSVATRLLSAFAISYLFVSIFAYYMILRTKKYTIKLNNPRDFLRLSKHNHFFGASLGFMDRFDRLLVGFLLATPVLGKYAVAITLVALLRFVPDGVSKLIIAKKVSLGRVAFLRKDLVVVCVLVFSFIVVFLSREITKSFLGPEWLLGVSIYLAISLQELMRGSYQVLANRNILNGFPKSVHTSATLLPLISIVGALLGVNLIGLIGVPLAFSAAYILGIFLIRSRNSV
jgi:O-antigen/teichoic acid export membrane protein